MVRRRTATLSLTAVALLAATPLLTSCGAEHPGSAAVVGGQTISMSTLQSQVKAVRDAQGGSAQSAQLIESTSDLDRTTLGGLVFDRVLDAAARQNGVTVTRAQVQQARSAAEAQAGGADALRDQLLQQYAVAPGGIDDFYRVQAEAQALARGLGVDLATPDGQAAVTKSLVKTAQSMRVDVNPRYGTWNAHTLTIGSASTPWLRHAIAPAPAA